MITAAKWDSTRRVLLVTLQSGERFSCGCAAANDWQSVGDGASRELVKAFVDGGGVIAEPDAVTSPSVSPARDRQRDLKKLEAAVAGADQSAVNVLLLKLLKEKT